MSILRSTYLKRVPQLRRLATNLKADNTLAFRVDSCFRILEGGLISPSYEKQRLLVELSGAFGSPQLAHNILDWIKELNPVENMTEANNLWEIIRLSGDPDVGNRIFDEFINDDRLIDSYPEPGVLHALGFLNCERALPVLWYYVQSSRIENKRIKWKKKMNQYSVIQACCMGLINLECQSLHQDIHNLILDLKGESLFADPLPMLALCCNMTAEELFDVTKQQSQLAQSGRIIGIGLNPHGGEKVFENKVLTDEFLIQEYANHSCLQDVIFELGMGVNYLYQKIIPEISDLKSGHDSLKRLMLLIDLYEGMTNRLMLTDQPIDYSELPEFCGILRTLCTRFCNDAPDQNLGDCFFDLCIRIDHLKTVSQEKDKRYQLLNLMTESGKGEYPN